MGKTWKDKPSKKRDIALKKAERGEIRTKLRRMFKENERKWSQDLYSVSI